VKRGYVKREGPFYSEAELGGELSSARIAEVSEGRARRYRQRRDGLSDIVARVYEDLARRNREKVHNATQEEEVGSRAQD
jgi:hypothetical protein